MTAPDGLRRVMVVLSDGEPNIGIGSPVALGDYVRSLRPLGVSSLGFGLHHDEDVLHAIATAGSGRYAYVPDPIAARIDLSPGQRSRTAASWPMSSSCDSGSPRA